MVNLRVQLSVIIPVHNEALSLPSFFNTLIPVLEALGIAYEIIAVDDGSTDESWAILQKACVQASNVRLLRLARCFGKEAAMQAGLAHASGAAAVLMDADLQHTPSTLEPMVKAWKEGAQIVLAQNARFSQREKSRVVCSRVFLKLFNIKNSRPVLPGTGDFQLIDRKVIEALNAMPERVRFLRGLSAWLGFKTVLVPYDCPRRAHGKSQYNLHTFWQLMMDGFAGFNHIPFTLTISVAGILALMGVLAMIMGIGSSGTSTGLTLVLSGLQLGAIGMVGEYIARVMREVQQRPPYIISETQGF